MRQTSKGKPWYFGMKAHIADLLHGKEQQVSHAQVPHQVVSTTRNPAS